ncbi:ABC transporter substrate-binding protein [Bradyrhizobium sp. STM 3561]|uniref:ABC transporter substrate-binding protein n=1 Tax=Bradyrhizobium sp. STM 3561 TaxID=578923 RepID=UPI00388F85CD
MPITVHWFVEPAVGIVARARSSSTAGCLYVDGVATKSSDDQFAALLSGAADAAITAMDNVMDWNLRAGGGDFRIVAQIERTIPLSLVSRAGVTGIQGLRGKTLLVDAPANGFVVAARALLDECGLPDGSYALKRAGGVRERFEALLAGSGDATLLGPPFDQMALARGAQVLSRVNDQYPAFPGQGLVMRRSSYERCRAGMAIWLAEIDHARALALTNKDVAVWHLTKTGLPGGLAEDMISFVPNSLVPEREGVDLLIAQRKRARLHGGDLTYSDLVDFDLLESIGHWREHNR